MDQQSQAGDRASETVTEPGITGGSSAVVLAPDITEQPPRPRKVWRAGNLTYTTGGLAALFFWLLWGDFTLFLRDRAVPPTLQLLLNEYGVSNLVAGFLLTTCPALITILLVPVISYRSDRHRGRWGRRLPYLLALTPLAVIAMVGLALSPSLGEWVHRHAPSISGNARTAVLWCLGFFWVLFEVSALLCLAVLNGLFNDVVPRELLGRFFGMFRTASVGAAVIFNFWLIGQAEKYYHTIFIAMALLYGVSFTTMCLRIQEPVYEPLPDAERSLGLKAAIVAYFRDCFSHPYYLWLFLSVALIQMAFSCVVTFQIFFAKSLNMNMDSYGWYLTVQFMVVFVQAYPLGWLADKIHPLRVILISLVLYFATTLGAFLFIHNATSFGIWLVISAVFAGWWLTAFPALGPCLLPKMKFAQFNSAMSSVSALGVLVIGPTCGWSLDAAGGDYRYTYLWATVLAGLSLLATLVVHKMFCDFGGPTKYVAPDIKPRSAQAIT